MDGRGRFTVPPGNERNDNGKPTMNEDVSSIKHGWIFQLVMLVFGCTFTWFAVPPGLED